uniref:Uncharacterized protein n=1 Tax=Wuchereria bancrofti TaxID=6293 RepID=A0A1I8E8K8_WUCBA
GPQTFRPNASPLLAVGLRLLLPLKSPFYVIIANSIAMDMNMQIRNKYRKVPTNNRSGEVFVLLSKKAALNTVLSDYFPLRHTEAATSRPSASIPQAFL